MKEEKMRLSRISRTALGFAAVLVATGAKAADEIQIATGNAGGLYFAAGEAICRALAQDPAMAAVPCRAVTSRGSMSNVLDLNAKTMPFAIVQTDIQYNAVAGLGLFETIGPDRDLRAVLSLHAEAFTVVVRADAKAATFNDLRGARLSAGRIGTGTRETAEALFEVQNWTPQDRANVVDLPVSDQSEALCTGKVDAIAVLMGHPSPLITTLADACAVKLLPVSGEAAEQLSRKLLYYRPATISGGTYTGNPEPIATIGLRAAVVTTADVPAPLVRRFTEAVFRNLGAVRDAAPAFAALRPDQMSTSGLIAPLHPGALEYFVAAGLPTPSVQVTPNANGPIPESSMRAPGKLVIDPKLQAPKPSAPSDAQKPAVTTIPVGPGDKWKLETGDFGNNNPALTGDGDLPAAQDNIRLKIPAQK
jgi:TRAP transporter TAXI family solute receptor